MIKIRKDKKGNVEISGSIKLEGNLMGMEQDILEVVNQIGKDLTAEAIKQFDTDGTPLIKNGVKLTAMSKNPKSYQTPFQFIKT